MKTTTLSAVLGDLKESLGLNENQKTRDMWLTSNDVCLELQIHPNTLYRIIKSGQLKTHSITVAKNSKRNYRIRREDLDDYLKRRYCPW